jgi:hypothetical protein
MLEKLYRELIERRAEMALAVFDSPPADWPAFQRRLGQYVELAALIDIVKNVMSGLENDE